MVQPLDGQHCVLLNPINKRVEMVDTGEDAPLVAWLAYNAAMQQTDEQTHL